MSERSRTVPLTRVEGHGVIEVTLDRDTVKDVRLDLKESPRLFEALLKGKHYLEIPEIICRICSICSSVHRVTSLKAIEQAFGIDLPPGIRSYQQLLVHGGHIESHALHLACLVLPDYHGVVSFAELARVAPAELQLGLRLKALGNKIQETIGGRTIHPVNLQVGGIGRQVPVACLLELRRELTDAIPCADHLLAVIAHHHPTCYPTDSQVFLALTPEAGDTLFGVDVALTTGQSFAVPDYARHWLEQPIDGSHDKRSSVCGCTVTVGALARLAFTPPATPQARAAWEHHRAILADGTMWANPLAQAIELIQSIEQAAVLVDRLLTCSAADFATAETICRAGTGTAACEAPRGILLHSYSFDEEGICTAADVITPTAVNHATLESSLRSLGKMMTGAVEKEIVWRMEQLVRAYDPCISCAVHLVRR